MRLIAILLFESLLILGNPLDKKQSEEWMDSNKINSEDMRMWNKSREVLVDNCPVVCEDPSGTKFCCMEDSDCCDNACCTENKQCCRRLDPDEQLTGDVNGNEDYKKSHEEIVPNQITVWELAVGQGDCTYIICPNNDLVILNMGSSSLSPFVLNQTDVSKIFVNYLDVYPYSKFRIILDPDEDHFSYVQDVLTGLESSVDYFILTGMEYQYQVGAFNSWLSTNFQNRIFTIKGSPCYGNTDCIIGPFSQDSPVITPNFCNDDLVKFTILAANFGDNFNDHKSTVIKMQYGDISILFPGDSSSDDELIDISVHYDIKGTKELNATIYKMIHYDFALDGDNYNFLYRISPQAAFTNQVCPTSSNYGFPRCSVVTNLVLLGIANDSRSYPFVCGNYHKKPSVIPQWNYQIYETCRELYSMCYNIRIQLDQNNYKIDYIPLDKPVVKSSDEGMEV